MTFGSRNAETTSTAIRGGGLDDAIHRAEWMYPLGAMKSHVLFRGISKKEFLEANLDGSWVGTGVCGNGTYFGYGSAWDTFRGYGNPMEGGWIYVAKLRAEAKVIEEDVLHDVYIEMLLSEKTMSYEVKEFLRDRGRLALYMGYDALATNEHIVVVNNRALVVDRRMLPGGSRTFQTRVRGIRSETEILNELRDKQEQLKAAGGTHPGLEAAIYALHDEYEDSYYEFREYVKFLAKEYGQHVD